jgi:hypothetical protein
MKYKRHQVESAAQESTQEQENSIEMSDISEKKGEFEGTMGGKLST